MKIIRSRDVVFDEKVMYKGRDNKQRSESTTSDGDTSEYFGLEDLPVDREVEQGFDQEEDRASDEAAP